MPEVNLVVKCVRKCSIESTICDRTRRPCMEWACVGCAVECSLIKQNFNNISSMFTGVESKKKNKAKKQGTAIRTRLFSLLLAIFKRILYILHPFGCVLLKTGLVSYISFNFTYTVSIFIILLPSLSVDFGPKLLLTFYPWTTWGECLI